MVLAGAEAAVGFLPARMVPVSMSATIQDCAGPSGAVVTAPTGGAAAAGPAPRTATSIREMITASGARGTTAERNHHACGADLEMVADQQLRQIRARRPRRRCSARNPSPAGRRPDP